MTDQTVGPDDLIFTRIFDASRDLVFRCMTEPEHLTHFWGPVGVRAPREKIRVDARPGDVFETAMVNKSHRTEYATRAIYEEVRPPGLLAWTDVSSGMQVRSEFVKIALDRTEVRIHQTGYPSPSSSPRHKRDSSPLSTALPTTWPSALEKRRRSDQR